MQHHVYLCQVLQHHHWCLPICQHGIEENEQKEESMFGHLALVALNFGDIINDSDMMS